MANVAAKVKVGLFRRLGNYFLNILNDYKAVALETAQDIKDRPGKTSIYFAGIITAGIFIKANPSAADLDEAVIESAHELSLLSSSIRNKDSDSFISQLSSAHRDGRLHHTSLMLCSLVWLSDYCEDLDLYEAQCKYTQLPWYEFHKKIVDVGFLGKFIKLSDKMKNYDVNEDEWKNGDDVST
ncbi:Mitochondrial import inner membrane translocase subunit Tim29 [Biomphalaria glabrata]|uniref:Mitochondrial import inner membrane translocase subunit Tim29-like n=1 Tax=Biomphalaria glabrata TaxID=6526 RepID=A0A2C9L1K9_BIOGL|nr:mitochondrial import inner membrane translocase subunit Tim29-like [Biomphalaria glabrata]KAI8754172.1 mitochondrial import inner membrane translocase subunit Tim29 [Biomphalaria glabrata]